MPLRCFEHAYQLPDEASWLMNQPCTNSGSYKAGCSGKTSAVSGAGLFSQCSADLTSHEGELMELYIISMLNISYGLLLFMLSSGLTLIFSMMESQFRSRELLHGQRLHWFHTVQLDRLLAR
jgi:hypothetical protein